MSPFFPDIKLQLDILACEEAIQENWFDKESRVILENIKDENQWPLQSWGQAEAVDCCLPSIVKGKRQTLWTHPSIPQPSGVSVSCPTLLGSQCTSIIAFIAVNPVTFGLVSEQYTPCIVFLQPLSLNLPHPLHPCPPPSKSSRYTFTQFFPFSVELERRCCSCDFVRLLVGSETVLMTKSIATEE